MLVLGGGNDLTSNSINNDEADEAGWRVEGDDSSQATVEKNNSTINRIRIGIQVTPPPSDNEPDKKVFQQA